MQKRPDRGRSWLGTNLMPLLLLIPVLIIAWAIMKDPMRVPLGYGELKQILQAPGVRFRDVKVNRTEIRGELTYQDQISGADLAKATDALAKNPDLPPPGTQTIAFRAAKQGFELDPDLQRLLDQNVGSG